MKEQKKRDLSANKKPIQKARSCSKLKPMVKPKWKKPQNLEIIY